jgi:hypothetical protein
MAIRFAERKARHGVATDSCAVGTTAFYGAADPGTRSPAEMTAPGRLKSAVFFVEVQAADPPPFTGEAAGSNEPMTTQQISTAQRRRVGLRGARARGRLRIY